MMPEVPAQSRSWVSTALWVTVCPQLEMGSVAA